MDLINHITIDDDVFIGSNVPENDAQEWAAGSAYAEGDDVMITTGTHKTYEAVAAQNAGITADILDEDYTSLTDLDIDEGGNGVVETPPAGQLRLDTNTSAAGNYLVRAINSGLSTLPATLSIETKTYFDAIGTLANNDNARLSLSSATWTFIANFCSDGLYITKASGVDGEVGADIVKCNANAAWQTWRFEIDKTTESAAVVEVFLKEEGGAFVSQGTFDCDYEVAGISGKCWFTQYGFTTDNMVSHVDYIKIGTGLGTFDTTNDSPVGNTNWLEVDSTNRWKAFNNVLGSQTEQATKIEYVLYPGETFDSLALLNMASDTVDIVACDTANDLITNGTDWTGATGTTQPTSWDKVGTPADFSIGDSVAYTSDFSADADGFTAVAGTVAGNIDSIDGQNDNLRFTVNTATNVHYIKKTGVFEVGKEYTINIDYYIPATNSDVDGIVLWHSFTGGTTTATTTTGEWATVTKHFTANSTDLIIYPGEDGRRTASDAGGDDIFYVRNIVITDGRQAVKITSDANGEGISQTITVSAATEYQLCGLYKNTSGDVAQYAIYDVTHSADIVAATDLPDATDYASFSKVFTTPAGCTSIKISLLAKTSTDIVWFDSIVCAPTSYSETVTTGTTKPDVVKLDLPGTATSLLTVTVNQSTTAKIGELIVGTKTSLGTTLASPAPKVSIADYSSQSQDAFGNWTIVQRGYAKKLTCSTKIEATETLTVRQNSDYIFGVLSACRSLMRVWIGDENLSCMIIYGKYDSFELELTCNNLSLLDLDILGMI